VEIVELVEQPQGEKHVVLCMPDAGLVGIIAGMHLVSSLRMEIVGYVDAAVLPPVAVVHKRQVRPPLQLYANSDLLVVVSEIPLPVEAFRPVASAIVGYLERLKPRSVTAIGGAPLPPATRAQLEAPEVYAVTTTEEEMKRIESQGVKPLEEGMVAGVYATILLEARRRKLPLTYLMTQSFLNIPDPGAAAEALKTLGRITGLDIDVKELTSRAEEIRVQVRDLMNRTATEMRRSGKQHELQIPAFYS